jgi:hypothetical protein
MATPKFGDRTAVPANIREVIETEGQIAIKQGNQDIIVSELTNTNIAAPLEQARGTFPTLPADYATTRYPSTSAIDD